MTYSFPLPARRSFTQWPARMASIGLTLVVACSPQTASSPTPDTAVPVSSDAAATNPTSDDSSTASTPPSETVHTNRLANETSPYLRMHAHNPVDWYPWGEEALQKAKDQNKVIFLSVGYSSCHWCHVMERESFMDREIATFLNENFVCIKVDREERPDVDAIYMTALQLLGGRGGWPMSVFMTPEAQPFFGGTYFPARDGDRLGVPGFLTVIQRVQDVWNTQQQDLLASAAKVTQALQQELGGQLVLSPAKLNASIVDRVQDDLASKFDPQYGGFGFDPADAQRPKFPEPSNLAFLIDRWQAADEEDSRKMLLTTLERMSRGGIWDHLGGGFHRYSVDRYWRIPHFEKMLYDNGQLLSAYSQAYQLTAQDELKWVVDDTVEHLLRDMRAPGGAFYAAMDADSENVEGKYYRWDRAEVQQLLGDDYALFASVYGVDQQPNFEGEHYVLQRSRPFEEIAAERNQSPQELRAQQKPLRAKLLAERNKRVPPLTDSKILCGWNGLAIRGLADAGRYCDNSSYVDAASQAANFVLANLRDENGHLLRTYSEGQAKLKAYLDDYAFLIDGLIGLHQATGDPGWLQTAGELMQLQIDLFWDEAAGGFFFTAKDHEQLIARSKQLVDGARPAGNSVSAANLVYLAEQLDKEDYREKARITAQNTAQIMDRMPSIAPRMTVVIDALVEEPDDTDTPSDDDASAGEAGRPTDPPPADAEENAPSGGSTEQPPGTEAAGADPGAEKQGE